MWLRLRFTDQENIIVFEIIYNADFKHPPFFSFIACFQLEGKGTGTASVFSPKPHKMMLLIIAQDTGCWEIVIL
jgi:hypothetical protein